VKDPINKHSASEIHEQTFLNAFNFHISLAVKSWRFVISVQECQRLANHLTLPPFKTELGSFDYLDKMAPGHNDIGLYDTSSIASDIPWYELIPRC